MSRLYKEDDTYENFKLRIDIRPTLDLEYRNYYNLKKRQKQGKQIHLNSANFLSILGRGMGSTIFHPSKDYNEGIIISIIATQWGIHRNYGNKFNFQFAIGPGFRTDHRFPYADFTILSDFYMGFRFGN